MERSGFGSSMTVAVAVAVLVFAMMVMVPEVSATRWTVGSNMGWTTNVNYTMWAQDKHFYNGDWLWVNKTDFESCNSDHPLHNLTRGAGRDVVPLNVTRNYYFISGKGFCYGGMKLAVHVANPLPPPTAAPLNEKSGSSSSILKCQCVLSTVFAIGALWDAFVWFW